MGIDIYYKDKGQHEVTLLSVIFFIVLQIDRVLITTLVEKHKALIDFMYFMFYSSLATYRVFMAEQNENTASVVIACEISFFLIVALIYVIIKTKMDQQLQEAED